MTGDPAFDSEEYAQAERERADEARYGKDEDAPEGFVWALVKADSPEQHLVGLYMEEARHLREAVQAMVTWFDAATYIDGSDLTEQVNILRAFLP